MTENLPQVGGMGFEGLKQINQFGAEYWTARDLQPLLGYRPLAEFREGHPESHNLLRAIG